MSLKLALNDLEEYQTLTSQEGSHIDDLRLSLKCFFLKSKWLAKQDKLLLRQRALNQLEQERRFCRTTYNFEAEEVISSLVNLLV
ncbi:hypothetical protein L1D34_28105 [Vibrio mediterranei]|uniref:hypothetical protein n=1 Tax=Vibrio mediterranei TaxID=689 RepID=UPI001EFD300A|nr:hypothetical protein [Vibrio mediterranei]MCG9628676.1 hypothetical protein [Vibrio mediterranei]